MFTKDGICTVAGVIIANPTRANLLPQSYTIQGFVASNAVQAKEMNYCNQHPTNQFLPLVTKLFGCLHKHVDVFLHDCANVVWSLKGLEGLHLSTLVTFFHQKSFNHITKDVSILHLKSGDNCSLSYFPTSTA
jgi:hypothetical protein